MGKVETRAGGLPPIKVFLVIAALLAAGVTTYVLTRDPATSGSTQLPTTEPADFPTEATFNNLNSLRIAAYENRDLQLLDDFAVDGSPVADAVSREISNLIDDGVTVRIDFSPLDFKVVANSPTEVVVDQTSEQSTVVLDSDGKSIGAQGGARIRVIRWTLHRENSTWLLFESETLSDEPS